MSETKEQHFCPECEGTETKFREFNISTSSKFLTREAECCKGCGNYLIPAQLGKDIEFFEKITGNEILEMKNLLKQCREYLISGDDNGRPGLGASKELIDLKENIKNILGDN